MMIPNMSIEEIVEESKKFEETDKFKNCMILDKKLSDLSSKLRFPDEYLKEAIINCDDEIVSYLLVHSFNLMSPDYYEELVLLAKENEYILNFIRSKCPKN